MATFRVLSWPSHGQVLAAASIVAKHENRASNKLTAWVDLIQRGRLYQCKQTRETSMIALAISAQTQVAPGRDVGYGIWAQVARAKI